MKNIVFCFFFLLCTRFAIAAETKDCNSCVFAGTVIDASTKKPVSDVMIIARGQESGDEQKFVTDQHGQYKIPSLPNGTYTIRFEKTNYKPVEKRNLSVKKTSASSKINIELVINDDEREEDHHNWLPKYDII